MPILLTSRLLLERLDETDRDSWRLMCQDPQVMRHVGSGGPWTIEEADDVFDNALAHWHEHGFGWRSIFDRATGVWVGSVVVNHVGYQASTVAEAEVSIGWWIARLAWGRGLATEAASAGRDESFATLGIERLLALIQPTNLGSVRVAQKIGMHFDRETTAPDGESLHIYALTRTGWAHGSACLEPESSEGKE
jgi:RimJ/RimL family protein N-acetyltransferase